MKPASAFSSLLALALLLAQPVTANAQAATAAAPPAAKAAAKPVIQTTDFGDWRQGCMTNKQGRKLCRLIQRVVGEDKKNVKLAAEASIIAEKDKDGKIKNVTRLLLIAPLGTLLIEKLTIKLDGEKPVHVPFLVCANGCMTDLALDGPLLEKMKTGKSLAVSYKQMNNKTVSVNVSLKGFADGLKSLNANKG